MNLNLKTKNQTYLQSKLRYTAKKLQNSYYAKTKKKKTRNEIPQVSNSFGQTHNTGYY